MHEHSIEKKKNLRFGAHGESNPGPLAPKASIIPLDHGRGCLSRVRALSALCRAAVCRGGKSNVCSVGYGRRLGRPSDTTAYSGGTAGPLLVVCIPPPGWGPRQMSQVRRSVRTCLLPDDDGRKVSTACEYCRPFVVQGHPSAGPLGMEF